MTHRNEVGFIIESYNSVVFDLGLSVSQSLSLPLVWYVCHKHTEVLGRPPLILE